MKNKLKFRRYQENLEIVSSKSKRVLKSSPSKREGSAKDKQTSFRQLSAVLVAIAK
jgi:hypothetical protein